MSCIGCGQIFSVRKYVLAGLSPNFLIQPIQPNYSPKFYAANTAKITIGCTAQKANTTNTVNTANALDHKLDTNFCIACIDCIVFRRGIQYNTIFCIESNLG